VLADRLPSPDCHSTRNVPGSGLGSASTPHSMPAMWPLPNQSEEGGGRGGWSGQWAQYPAERQEQTSHRLTLEYCRAADCTRAPAPCCPANHFVTSRTRGCAEAVEGAARQFDSRVLEFSAARAALLTAGCPRAHAAVAAAAAAAAARGLTGEGCGWLGL
jgi:hypothetical protein